MRSFPTLPDWVALEHDVASILTKQQLHGWQFDVNAAWKLASSLRSELEEASQLLRKKHPYVKGSEFTPKRTNKSLGYVEECTCTKLKELNPTSRAHIAWILQTFHGWIPTEMSPTGMPIIDEVILKDIGTEIALGFLKCLDITKKLGMISEGTNAWLRLCTSANRIHHYCAVSTFTHRCAHRKPNLAQCPSGHEFRELFIPTPGQVMVGADLSGIELRMLGHYISRYSTEFSDTLLNGDIHQVNADKVGVSRRAIKTITYAFLYGSADTRLGHSFDSSLNDSDAKSKGAEIREAFVSAIDGLEELLKAIKKASQKGFIKSIDGRKIALDSPHKALNYLLQSGAGVVAKRWLLINQQTIKSTKLCCAQLAFIHDELQFECHPDHAADLSASLVSSAAEAGEYYNLRVPIAAEAKQGKNWAEVH